MYQQCPICHELLDMDFRTAVLTCGNQHICCKYCHRTIMSQKKTASCPICREPIKHQTVNPLYGQCQRSILQIKTYNEVAISKQKEKFAKTFIQLLFYPLENILSPRFIKEFAVELMRISQFDVAIPIFRRFIQAEQLFCEKELFLGLGSSENQCGLNENCGIEWYLNRYGKDISMFDLLALCQLFMRDIQPIHQKIDEQSWYKRILLERPSCFQLWFGLAVERHNQGYEREALQLYFKVIEMQPTFAKSFEMVAFLYYNCQAHKLAEHYAKECLESEPLNLFASFIICALSRQKFYVISQWIGKIMELEPGYIRPLFALGTKDIKERLIIRGRQSFERCIRINPYFLNAIEEFAFHDPEKHGKDILSRYFLQFKRNSMQLSRYYWSMGCVQKAHQKLEEAKNLFNLAIKTNPSNSESYEQLIEIYWKQKNYKHLAETWERYWIYFQKQNLRMHHPNRIIMGIVASIASKDSVKKKANDFIRLWKDLNANNNFRWMFSKNKQYKKVWFYEYYLNTIESSLRYPTIFPIICLYIGRMINYVWSPNLSDFIMSQYKFSKIKEQEQSNITIIMGELNRVLQKARAKM